MKKFVKEFMKNGKLFHALMVLENGNYLMTENAPMKHLTLNLKQKNSDFQKQMLREATLAEKNQDHDDSDDHVKTKNNYN